MEPLSQSEGTAFFKRLGYLQTVRRYALLPNSSTRLGMSYFGMAATMEFVEVVFI